MNILLTGATGLLGSYLMRDFLLRGHGIAVLVRGNRRESPAERVEAMLARWEDSWKRTLPRPVVLNGDITANGLGLSHADRRWLASNCDAMLHSAASLTFYEKDGEPWRSNVAGVEHVLDCCEEAGIRKLYHVSTAYTCGLRDGVVYENELEVGQDFGNDYERSKVQAEKLVLAATHLDVATIFRPTIIVGDSQTGFSSTFHGFYTPLRLICAMLTQLNHEQLFDIDFLAAMGLTGNEGKNLVPVDWVSRAIVSIIERYPESSQAYAMASDTAITTDRILKVFREVTRKHFGLTTPNVPNSTFSLDAISSDPVLAAYVDKLQVYRSYWRNDPVFDCSNTRAALPDIPNPALTDEVLGRLAEWAVKSKFTTPVAERSDWKSTTQLHANRGLQRLPSENQPSLVLTITGKRGGSWIVDVADNSRPRIYAGRFDGATEVYLSSSTFQRIISKDMTLDDAVTGGDVVVTGTRDSSWRNDLESLLTDLPQ